MFQKWVFSGDVVEPRRCYASVGSKVIAEKEDKSYIESDVEKLCKYVCINFYIQGSSIFDMQIFVFHLIHYLTTSVFLTSHANAEYNCFKILSIVLERAHEFIHWLFCRWRARSKNTSRFGIPAMVVRARSEATSSTWGSWSRSWWMALLEGTSKGMHKAYLLKRFNWSIQNEEIVIVGSVWYKTHYIYLFS